MDARSVQILEPESWPRADSVSLNQSQLIAIQAALTEEFVVIQGPPGTGKTYVGLKIVQALLQNQDYWRRNQMSAGPMLVVCYTNHALDQFLEGNCKCQERAVEFNISYLKHLYHFNSLPNVRF